MTAEDALLLIDANKYLDLYRTDKGRKLLAPLSEQASYIFVTQQIVDEVQRNKLGVVADFLRTKSQDMKFRGINVPDQFSGTVTGKTQEILRQMRDIDTSVARLNAQIDAHTLEVMTQVAESKDDVSKALAPILLNAVQPSPEEMKRARQRREVGNPPGKRNDPLGDEITWEQVLSHFIGKKRLWIISRDGDYGTRFGNGSFLNSFLRLELAQIADDPVVYIFEDLVEGLTHFVETAGVPAMIKLTTEELTEIETEEKSLPPVDSPRYSSSLSQPGWSATEMQRAFDALKPTAEVQRVLDALKPTAEVQRVLDALKPTAEVQRVLDALKPTAEVQRVLDALKPTADVQRVLDALKPLHDIQRTLDAIKPSAEAPDG